MQDAGMQTPHLQSSPDSPWPFDPDAEGYRGDVAGLFLDGFADVETRSDISKVVVESMSIDRGAMLFSAKMKFIRGEYSVSAQGSASIGTKDYSVVWFHGIGALVLDNGAVLSFDGGLDGVSMALSPSAMSYEPDRLYGLQLLNPDMPDEEIGVDRGDGSYSNTGMVVDQGPVKLVAGNNISLGGLDSLENGMFGISANSLPFFSEIGDAVVISASPGAGTGRVKRNCPELGLPGNVVSDALGNVVIETDDCFQLEVDTASGVVKVIGKCTACCQCDDYVESGDKMADESKELNRIHGMLLADSELYNANVRLFNEAIAGM